MAQVKAKKALGQHFLTDLNVAKRIAATIEKDNLPDDAKIWSDLPVLEVGPGMGVLSQFLMLAHRRVHSGTYEKEFYRICFLCDLVSIFFPYLLPVDVFFFKEAIPLVYYVP